MGGWRGAPCSSSRSASGSAPKAEAKCIGSAPKPAKCIGSAVNEPIRNTVLGTTARGAISRSVRRSRSVTSILGSKYTRRNRSACGLRRVGLVGAQLDAGELADPLDDLRR